MKKIIYSLLFLTVCLLGITNIEASGNILESIDMDVYIDSNGNAKITEKWNMYLSSGTEIYKPMSNMGNSKLTNFTVSEGGKQYTYVDWDTRKSLGQKKYKNGINKTSDGFELCWGIGSYGSHDYKITYQISNFISNLNDGSQIAYWKLVNDSMNPSPNKVNITIHSDFKYNNSVKIWGFGYDGKINIINGKIKIESSGISGSQYVVLLAQFNPNTFNTTNKLDKSFDKIYDMAMKGTFTNTSIIDVLFAIFTFICCFIPFVVIFVIIIVCSNKYRNYDFGETGKKIDYKKINYFRDIPCNKDIFRAYFISTIYGINKKETDFLGAILLKWLKEGKIKVEKLEDKAFSKNNYRIDMTGIFESPNYLEVSLYNMMSSATTDGYLESKEFSKWCSRHYTEILGWFEKAINYEREILISEGKITEIEKGKFKIKHYIIDSSLKNEAIELAGLKKFLKDFTRIQEREAIEVNLFDEYLIYAQIFGIALKVAEQFKKLYPDVITDVRYDDFIMINSFYHVGLSSAYSARSAASGGGGSSFGGGGGGSFGGGSGGGVR